MINNPIQNRFFFVTVILNLITLIKNYILLLLVSIVYMFSIMPRPYQSLQNYYTSNVLLISPFPRLEGYNILKKPYFFTVI